MLTTDLVTQEFVIVRFIVVRGDLTTNLGGIGPCDKVLHRPGIRVLCQRAKQAIKSHTEPGYGPQRTNNVLPWLVCRVSTKLVENNSKAHIHFRSSGVSLFYKAWNFCGSDIMGHSSSGFSLWLWAGLGRGGHLVTSMAGSVTVVGPTRTCPCSTKVTDSVKVSAIFSLAITTGRRRLRQEEAISHMIGKHILLEMFSGPTER